MTFNLNSAFKWTGISYTDYDGDQFAKIKGFKAYLVYGYSRFWLIFIIYDFVRFSILALYPRNTIAHELMGRIS